VSYWNENIEPEYVIPNNVLDIGFKMSRTEIPVDNVWQLSSVIHKLLPWFSNTKFCGVHPVYGAGSANGWERPGNSEKLYLSARTRLLLRIPREYISHTKEVLEDRRLECQSFSVQLGKVAEKPLYPHETLYCRNLLCSENISEDEFITNCVLQLSELGIKPQKLICGLPSQIKKSDGMQFCRSLLIADLSREESIRLQHHGLGELRIFGFGLFVPYKSIAPVFTNSNSVMTINPNTNKSFNI